jgi:hypothetical protein
VPMERNFVLVRAFLVKRWASGERLIMRIALDRLGNYRPI